MACTPRYFAQIFDSSIVEKPEVRFTFMDLLVLADPDGVVDMTHEAIARRTNRPLEIIRATIAELEAPDPQSRTPDEDGARLKRLDTHRDWGWCIINFDRFHKLASEEARRAKTRERVTKYRDKVRENPHSNAPVTQGNAPKRKKRHVDVDVDVDTDVDTDVEEETTLPPDGGDQISESVKPGPKKEKKVKKKPDDPPAPRPRNIWWDAICDKSGDEKQPLLNESPTQKATGDKKQPVTKSHTPGDKKQPEAVTKSHHKRQNQEENHSAATPRERNKYWDAICDIFGMKPVTKQDKSRLGKLSRDFKLKCEADGAAPDEIDVRREVLSVRWAKNDEPAVVTPEALLKHWDSAKEIREDPFDIRPVTPEEEAQMQAEVDAIPEADFIAQYHAWIARVSPDKISRINPRAVRLGLPIPPGLTLDKDGFVVNPVVQEGAVE